MSEPTKDALRQLLKQELQKLTVEAETEGAVSAERVELVNKLGKLIETRDSFEPKGRNRWAAAVFVATLTLVSLLLFVRVRETEIELDVSLSQLSFALAKAQVVTGAMNLSSFGASGLREVQWPESAGLGDSVRPPPMAVLMTPGTVEARLGTVTLQPLPLSTGTRLEFERTEELNQYRLTVGASDLPFTVTVYGPMKAGVAGERIRSVDFSIPKQVALRGGPRDVSLALTFAGMPQDVVAPQLEVRNLSFLHVEQFLDAKQSLVKRLSSIAAGTLLLESLNGEEVRLRAGEDLEFARSRGEIRRLSLGAQHMDVQFRGWVSGMSIGSGEAHRSIMPTYLEWLKARHSLSLLWGTSLYLFGIVAGALRWWGVRVQD